MLKRSIFLTLLIISTHSYAGKLLCGQSNIDMTIAVTNLQSKVDVYGAGNQVSKPTFYEHNNNPQNYIVCVAVNT